MDLLIYALSASFIASIIMIASNSFHGHLTNDLDVTSVQKFHTNPVPRIGGLAILIGFITVCLLSQGAEQAFFFKLVIAALPIFCIGFVEDVTKKISARLRLYVSFFSGALAYFLLDIHFSRVDFIWFDAVIFSLPVISFVMTLLVVAGTVHAMNLIDGFNGLMLGVTLMALMTIALICYQLSDQELLKICLVSIGAVGGLFILNFPFGKIFTGDGGAYFVGFILATIVLMLVQRHSEVSAWFPCLLLAYPIFETLFSIYRKVYLRKMAAMQPDGVHLHMLVFKRLMRNKRFSNEAINNAMTSPILWLLSAVAIIPAYLFWNSTLLTIIFSFVFTLVYLRMYWYMVLFKRPIRFVKPGRVLNQESQLTKELS